MSRRSLARQAAVQVLYQDEFNPQRSRDTDRQYILTQVDEDSTLSDFAWWLIDGTRQSKETLDPEIEAAAEHWSVYRMSAVDRSLIRMAAFECRSGSTPMPVAIDEAIRLAKRFGGKESPAFVNGVLDKLLTDNERSVSCDPVASLEEQAVNEERTGNGTSTNSAGLHRFLKRDSK